MSTPVNSNGNANGNGNGAYANGNGNGNGSYSQHLKPAFNAQTPTSSVKLPEVFTSDQRLEPEDSSSETGLSVHDEEDGQSYRGEDGDE